MLSLQGSNSARTQLSAVSRKGRLPLTSFPPLLAALLWLLCMYLGAYASHIMLTLNYSLLAKSAAVNGSSHRNYPLAGYWTRCGGEISSFFQAPLGTAAISIAGPFLDMMPK